MTRGCVHASIGLAALAAIVASTSATAAPHRGEKATILSLRAQHNRAIAARDLDAIVKINADDSVLVGGSGGIERGREAIRQGWAEEFESTEYRRYVRTAKSVELGERKGVLRAAEAGRWEGFFRRPSGEARPYGRYFVHWTKRSGQWRVVAETYVTMGCRGPGC